MRGLARRGVKLAQAADEVRAATASTQIHTLELDLSSLESVRHAAESFKKRFAKLHVLIKAIPDLYLDTAVRTRLWTESAKLVGLN